MLIIIGGELETCRVVDALSVCPHAERGSVRLASAASRGDVVPRRPSYDSLIYVKGEADHYLDHHRYEQVLVDPRAVVPEAPARSQKQQINIKSGNKIQKVG